MSFLLFLFLAYWMPTIIAMVRGAPFVLGIALFNFFGFLIVPWWLALIWSLAARPYERVVIIEGRARY